MSQPHKPISEAHVLVVEDDENNRLVATKLLELAGVPPTNILAIDGDPMDFLRARLPQKVDLILLDLQLPGKDGYKVLQELRSDPELAHTSVVVVTANVMREDVERAQSAGFDGFIGKPINGPRFKGWLERLLAGEMVWSAVS